MTVTQNQLFHRSDGQLRLLHSDREVAVRVVPCFPWTEPHLHFSLRNEKGEEVAWIEDPMELDPQSKESLARARAEAGFVLEVEAVESVDEEFQLRNWKVRTRQGAMIFQTELDTWPTRLPGGGLLIRDVSGNLFHVVDPSRLSEKCRQILWAYID